MPPKVAPRRWGSRYDAIKHLPDSPRSTNFTDTASVSSLSSTGVSRDVETNSVSEHASVDGNNSGWFSRQDENHRPPPSGENHVSGEYGTYTQRRPLARWNHNASVFVASLPIHLPQGEVDAIIRDTLGLHGKIINVKMINDIKSGNVANCAFVQFETPDQAYAAIQACHNTFVHGRPIRCEPAKAYRTLIVSFRPVPKVGPAFTPHEWVRLRRPDWRSRFVKVTFNQEARDWVPEDPADWRFSAEDPLQGPGTLISLDSDVPRIETLKLIVTSFGPFEMMRPFRIPPPEEVGGLPFAPHPPNYGGEPEDEETAPSWEIKWEQRNDALSAYHSLTSFPDLIVTWAHEHPHPSFFRSREGMQGVRDEPPFQRGGQHGPMANQAYPQTLHPEASPPRIGPQHNQPNRPHLNLNLGHRSSEPNTTSAPSSRIIVSLPRTPVVVDTPLPEDFPPLDVPSEDIKKSKSPHRYRNQKHVVIPELSHNTSIEAVNGDEEDPQSPTPSEPLANQIPPDVENAPKVIDNSSIEPQSPSVPLSPETPQSLVHSPLRTPSTVAPLTPSPVMRMRHIPGDSLFIGGLSKQVGWSEDDIINIFKKYGILASVRLFFKGTYTEGSGHAFVKYEDPSCMQKAIAGEHEKVYKDRKIYVSLSTGTRYGPPRPPYLHYRESPTQGLGLEGMELKHFPTDPRPVIVLEEDTPTPQDVVEFPVMDSSPTRHTAVNTTPTRSKRDEGHHKQPAPTPPASKLTAAPSAKSLSPSELRDEDDRHSIHADKPSPIRAARKTAPKGRSRAHSDPSASSIVALRASGSFELRPLHYPEAYVPYAPPAIVYYQAAPVAYPTSAVANGPGYTSWRPYQIPQANFYPQPAFPPYAPLHPGSNVSISGTASPASSASSLPHPHPPHPHASLQASGYMQNEQGVFVPIYPTDTLDHHVAAPGSFANWSDHGPPVPAWVSQDMGLTQSPAEWNNVARPGGGFAGPQPSHQVHAPQQQQPHQQRTHHTGYPTIHAIQNGGPLDPSMGRGQGLYIGSGGNTTPTKPQRPSFHHQPQSQHEPMQLDETYHASGPLMQNGGEGRKHDQRHVPRQAKASFHHHFPATYSGPPLPPSMHMPHLLFGGASMHQPQVAWNVAPAAYENC